MEARNTRKQRGQGMTEYIIIVALIAIGAIGVYNMFGKTVRNQMAGVAQGLAGKETEAKTAITNAATSANQAASDANNKRGLDSFADKTGAR